MKVGFTGTRDKYIITDAQSENMAARLSALDNLGRISEVHHGDCVGADAVFHFRSWEQGYRVVIHPPLDEKLRAWCDIDPINGGVILSPKEYLRRNKEIVEATDILFAMPGQRDEQQRSGTWSTIRYARSLGRPIFIFFPNGDVVEENTTGLWELILKDWAGV